MTKITTSFLRKEMKVWFEANRDYFENRLYGCKPPTSAASVIDSKWKRISKCKVKNSTTNPEADVASTLNGGRTTGDITFVDFEYLDANKVIPGDCLERIFIEEVALNFLIEIYTDPSDSHVIMWTLIAD